MALVRVLVSSMMTSLLVEGSVLLVCSVEVSVVVVLLPLLPESPSDRSPLIGVTGLLRLVSDTFLLNLCVNIVVCIAA